ncbi:MAG: hypothetical protein ACFBRM_02540 [Pikeienuella sp.]
MEPATTVPPPAVTISAGLVPAEAKAERQRLLDALSQAQLGAKRLSIEIDGAPALPCALQLLAATQVSAKSAGIALDLGPAAAAALDNATSNAANGATD